MAAAPIVDEMNIEPVTVIASNDAAGVVPQSRWWRVGVALLPWLGYALVTLILLRRLLPQVAEYVPGLRNGWQNVWNLWWMRWSLLRLHVNPFFTDYLYYPTGSSLLFHTYAPLNGVLFLPFTYTLGPLLTVNIVMISSFVFSAMAAYALARVLGLGMFGAWLAGLVYSFCNPARWHYFGGGQADHLAMWWMPLYILCIVKATEQDSEHISQVSQADSESPITQNSKLKTQNSKLFWLLGGAVFLAANGLTDWQFFVYMLVFTFCYAVYLLIRERTWRARAWAVGKLAIIGIGAAILLGPLLYASISEALGSSYMVRPIEQTEAHTFDLTTYFTPNAINPLWGNWAAAQNYSGNNYGDILGISNSGYLPLILAVVGMVVYWRRTRAWAIFGIIFAVLSLGTHLYINEADTFGPGNWQIPLPYNLLLAVPFFNISRNPSRFSLIAFLCVGILMGFGWQWLAARQWLRPVLARSVVAVIVVAVTLFEFAAVPYVTTTQPISPFYQQLGQDTAQYAILELPIADKYYAEYSEALESVHHKQVMGGMTARKPCYCFAMQNPPFDWFWNFSLPATNDIVTMPPATIAPAVLAHYNIRYIVIWKWILTPEKYAQAQQLVAATMPGSQPVADDDTITAYAVPLTATTDLLPISLDDNWPEREDSPFGPQRWVWDAAVTFKVMNASNVPRQATLQLKLQAFSQPRTVQVKVNGQRLPAQPIQPQLQTISVLVTLAPGSNELSLSSAEPPIAPNSIDPKSGDRRPLTFAVLGIEVK